jgi:hypothetical protein
MFEKPTESIEATVSFSSYVIRTNRVRECSSTDLVQVYLIRASLRTVSSLKTSCWMEFFQWQIEIVVIVRRVQEDTAPPHKTAPSFLVSFLQQRQHVPANTAPMTARTNEKIRSKTFYIFLCDVLARVMLNTAQETPSCYDGYAYLRNGQIERLFPKRPSLTVRLQKPSSE